MEVRRRWLDVNSEGSMSSGGPPFSLILNLCSMFGVDGCHRIR